MKIQVGFVGAYFAPMERNDPLCMAWKWQRGDVSRLTGGDLSEALGRVTAKIPVMPIDEEDMFFPRATALRSGSSSPTASYASSKARAAT